MHPLKTTISKLVMVFLGISIIMHYIFLIISVFLWSFYTRIRSSSWFTPYSTLQQCRPLLIDGLFYRFFSKKMKEGGKNKKRITERKNPKIKKNKYYYCVFFKFYFLSFLQKTVNSGLTVILFFFVKPKNLNSFWNNILLSADILTICILKCDLF